MKKIINIITGKNNNQNTSPLKTARHRLVILCGSLMVFFLALVGQLTKLTIYNYQPTDTLGEINDQTLTLVQKRSKIVDRTGVALATSLETATLYADPQEIINPKLAAQQLSMILPDINKKEIEAKLSTTKRFVYLYRNLTPKQKYDINALGMPGLHFESKEKRFYLHNNLFAHVLGLTDTDGNGIAGVEKSFDEFLKTKDEALELSLDVRLQHIFKEEITNTIQHFKAIGGMGMMMDIYSGEILAMTSLPDFDPNHFSGATDFQRFNRNTTGVYEMGSSFKLITAAMALESGTVTFNDGYDASQPIRIARHTINDYKGKKRWLTVPEIVVFSSNIGAAKMALDVGSTKQRSFLKKLGLLSPTRIELPEIGSPLYPSASKWQECTTMTIGFGHGMAITPLQNLAAIAAVSNGGVYHKPTILKVKNRKEIQGQRVVSTKTSNQVAKLMRAVVLGGTGRKAAIPGYCVAGKSGTSEKVIGKRYSKKLSVTSFVGVFPIHNPQYALIVMVDEPKGLKETFGYATGGWVAAPLAGKIISRVAPILNIQPVDESSDEIIEQTFIKSLMVPTDNRKGVRFASFRTH
jgi:cell division protein FtsI (penicillin-binding protein 3)